MPSNLIWSANRDGGNFPRTGRNFAVQTAGDHLLIVSGSACNTVNDTFISVEVHVNRDGGNSLVGRLGVFVNSGPRWHQDMVTSYVQIRLEKTTPGNYHNIMLLPGPNTVFDNEDWFNILLIENQGTFTAAVA